MNPRKERTLLTNALVGASLFALDSIRDLLAENGRKWRDRARDRYGDLRSRAEDAYSETSERLGRASDAIQGKQHPVLTSVAAALVGVGVGVGIGLLISPARAEGYRRGEHVRFSDISSATGT
jgi:ElaB/YqjD/DUF883 family membrane-anchored ribosome-binding protein